MRAYLLIGLTACLPALLFAGCSKSPAGAIVKPVVVDSHLCQTALPYTTLSVAAYTVTIFEPNDPKSPDIWQGPVCVRSEVNQVDCGFDLSLVKSVKPTDDMKAIEVVTFSGSTSRTVRIELATCKLERLN